MKKITLMDKLAGTARGKEARNALAASDSKASKDYHKKMLSAKKRKLATIARRKRRADETKLYAAKKARKQEIKEAAMYASN